MKERGKDQHFYRSLLNIQLTLPYVGGFEVEVKRHKTVAADGVSSDPALERWHTIECYRKPYQPAPKEPRSGWRKEQNG